MGLPWKKRSKLITIVFICYLASMLINPLTQLLENDINFREAYFFDGEQYVIFEIYNTTSDQTNKLEIQGIKVNETHTKVSLLLDNDNIGEFWVNPEGFIYTDGILQENIYSVWWIYIPNQLLFRGVSEGDFFSVQDPTGFFVESNKTLHYEVIDKFVFYPVLPQHKNLSGAQASFEATLFENETHVKLGSFIFDTTSGALEQADVLIHDHWCQILLVETSYEISRNRYVLLVTNIIVGVGVFSLILFSDIMKIKRRKNQEKHDKQEEHEEHGEKSVFNDISQNVEFYVLFLTGVLCTTLDIVDTWFYHGVGFVNSLLIDLGYILILILICKKFNYGYKWILPALFEFLYARPFRGRMMIPFIGITLAWFGIIWASGVAFARNEDFKSENSFMEKLI